MRRYSIIIAVYNVQKYLDQCLESVLMQKYIDWECILVDDGSTDNSLEICEEYAKRDGRFKVFHCENQGSLMARRYGLSQSQGDYLLFIDSDDYIHRNLLKDVDEIIAATQSDLVIYRFKWVNNFQVSDSELIFPEGTIIGEGGLSKKVLWEKLPTCNSLNNLWLKVVKRQCLDLDVDYSKYAFLQFGTDLVQSLPILDRAQKIYFTEKIYYYYRYNDTGISSQKAKVKNQESIDQYFHTKNTIFKLKLDYLKKYDADSEKMIRSQYASYFRGCMEILINWLVHESDKKLREQIKKRTLQNPGLLSCRHYLLMEELTGVYQKLYEYYKNKNFNKMNTIIDILVFYRKIVLLRGHIIACFFNRKSRGISWLY